MMMIKTSPLHSAPRTDVRDSEVKTQGFQLYVHLQCI